MIKLQVKVTKEILRESMYCNQQYHNNCAIAIAIKEIFPKSETYGESVFILGSDSEVYPIMGLEAKHDGKEFIEKFDKSNPQKRSLMPETIVTLDITDEILEKINLEDMSNMVSKIEHLELIEEEGG